MTPSKFPISTVAELANLLGMSEYSLRCLAKSTKTSYVYWNEPKPSGGHRELSSPTPRLKKVQRKIHKLIFSKVDFGPFSQYGVKGKSNISNAYAHYGCDIIFTFDLKSFFPSVRPERVKRALIDELGCTPSLAAFITKLVTVNYQLPQGAPTSTDIANIVTLRLQRRLFPLAKQWGIKEFTIYADDLTFSGNNIPDGFDRMVTRIVRDEGFKIHPKKGGIFNKSQIQNVTGINIAHGPTVGKLKKKWRAEHYENIVRQQKGEISDEDLVTSERRYASRLAYANFTKKFHLPT